MIYLGNTVITTESKICILLAPSNKSEPNLFSSLFLSENNFLHFRLLSLPKDKQKRWGRPDLKAEVMKWGTGVACAHSPSHFTAFHSSVLSCYLKQLESAVQSGWGFLGALDRASNFGPWKGVEVIHVTTQSGSVLKKSWSTFPGWILVDTQGESGGHHECGNHIWKLAGLWASWISEEPGIPRTTSPDLHSLPTTGWIEVNKK